MHSLGKRLILIFAVVWLAACKDVTIELPTDDYLDDDAPSLFKVNFSKGIPSDLKLQLNTVEVSQLFTVSETGAEATGATLASYIYPGRNVFRAATGSKSSQVYFYYDTEGPAIHILSADRSTGVISGYLDDPGGVVSLAIDGTNVPIDGDNQFSSSFSNMAFNELVAVDGFGHTSTTTYARNDREFNPSISARLNQGGISFLGDALGQALGSIDFQAFVDDLNPILSFNFIGFFTAAVEVKNFGFDEPIIELDVLNNERLATHVEIPNFSIGIELGGKTAFFIPWSVGGTVYIENLVLDTQVLLDIVNNDLDVDLSNTQVDTQGFHLDLDHIPNILGFENFLSVIVDGIADFFIPFFVGIIEEIIVPIVSDFISDIPISLDLTTPENETLRVKALPMFLDTFENGLTIDLGARISAPFPSAEAVATLGSHYVAGDTPTIGNTTPDGEPFDVGASLSSNIINQALLAAHESGITTMQIRPDNTPGTDPEGVSVVQTEDDDIQQNDLLGMKVLPASPPFIKLLDREGAYGVLGWYDLTLEFDLKRIGWEDYRTVFKATFNIEVPFELGATDDGFLHIGIEQLPTITVLESENAGWIQLTPGFINGILDRFMPVILPKVTDRLKAIPLPRIAGHSIHPEDFWISGTGKNNLSLAGSLVKLSDTAAAPAPTTILGFSSRSNTVSRTKAVRAGDVVAQATELVVENGAVQISVRGNNPSTGALEYRYQVDNGPWSVWKQRSSIQLQQLLGGDHNVTVCSRTVLMKQEQDCPSVSFTTQAL